ncbi:MAG: twin-arginine translocase TatA/TatE family subunit [Armatimonadetes bacterium]|nr:twin-arginine translocase TatA/TatE family subunit [Armatimonadota bacterium]
MLNLAFYNSPVAIVVLIVVLVLFGGAKIPEMMRGLGQGVRELKKGINESNDDDELQKEKENKERERLKAELRAEIDREKSDKNDKNVK